MTDRDQPITLGQKDSVKVTGLMLAGMADTLLVILGIVGIGAARPASVAAVAGIIVLVILTGSAVSWFMWRMTRIRLEISESGITQVNLVFKQHFSMSNVRRVDAVDGASLRPRIVGLDGVRVYLPVVRLNVSPGDLPVRQLAGYTMKDAEVNADSLRWMLDRAGRATGPLDPTARPAIPWHDDH